jgi:hypothetical protein
MLETMITIYILIAVAMIIFDCFFIVVMNLRHYIGKRQLQKHRNMIIRQLTNLLVGRPIDPGHNKKLINLMKHAALLPKFSDALELVKKEIREESLTLPSPCNGKPAKVSRRDGERCMERYMAYLAATSETLFEKYRKKDRTVYTYYIFFLRRHGILKYIFNSSISAYLRDLLETGDIYVCENVLQAIFTVRDPKLVVQALHIVDKKEIFIHSKIISEGLLCYDGDVMALQILLLEERTRFTVQMQVSILNYIRFSSGAHCERIFDILQNGEADDEVRYACIRYFGKYHYDPAYPILRDYVNADYNENDEYCLISLTALRQYPGDETVSLLIKNLRSTNWYIRYNASESLSALGVDYADLVEVFDGQDAFARDIMQFQLDRRNAREEEVSTL